VIPYKANKGIWVYPMILNPFLHLALVLQNKDPTFFFLYNRNTEQGGFIDKTLSDENSLRIYAPQLE
jgi:hypothetical protein